MKLYKSINIRLFHKVALLLGALALFLPAHLFAGKVDSHSIAAADSAYAAGEYEEAQKIYGKIIDDNGATASLLYNLANAYYKNGNEGMSRLMLERAKRLDPSSAKIQRNIEYLQSRIEDANKAEMKGKKGSVSPDNVGFFASLKRSISENVSSNTWAEWAAAFFVLFILALGCYFLVSHVKLRKIGFFSSIIFIILSVIFVIFAEMAANHYQSKDEAVMTAFKATLLEEPKSDARAVGFPLHRGTKFDVIDSELDAEGNVGWYEVRLNSSTIGWLPADAITII